MPLAQVMQEFGVSRYVVHRLVDEASVELQLPRTRRDEHELAISLYQEGLSLASVGKRLGRDPTTVRNILERAGIARRNTQGL